MANARQRESRKKAGLAALAGILALIMILSMVAPFLLAPAAEPRYEYEVITEGADQ
ncbi:MAG: hypothetical protein LBK41_03215 [Clostridiales bacterium]|jgi:hypothetical protein|nr:hypothetical protein [Clostridiales bacterium]